MSKIITKYFTRKIAGAVQSELSGNLYYFALSKPTLWADENNPDTAINTTKAINDFHREMILGKRIETPDIAPLIKRYYWVSNTVYAQYDDTDPDLYEKQFYVVNSSEEVFKCLFNNNGVPSTVQPTTVSTNKFQTADGYVWKYMYTISSANNTKFSTTTFIPVDANSSVTTAAANGAIDVISIESRGSEYRGYISGIVTQILSNTLFQISSSTGTLSPENFYYNSSGFYIVDGTGEGQLTTISNYVVNSSGYFVYTSDQLNNPQLDLTSGFRIAPQIKIEGDGTGAKAICTVNTISGSYFIESVDVLNPGQNYSYADVHVVANPSYGSGAVLRAIVPPLGGHGADVATELGCQHLGVSLFFNNNESGSISTNVEFRQAGIINTPYKFTYPPTTKTFNGFNSVSNTDDTISFTDANTYFKPGDYVKYVTSSGNTAVTGLANNTFYYVIESNTSTIKLSTTFKGPAVNISSTVNETGHILYTTNVFASETFNALTYLNISSSSGSFVTLETVVGGTSNAQATVVYANSSIVKVMTPKGAFANGETITGNDSQATASISSINNPDIQPFTSSVLYIDNVQAITRSDNEFEQAYLVLTL